MEFLPSSEEQQIMLQHLFSLIRKQGKETFLQRPILEPTPKHFPFRVSSNGVGAFRIAEYLLYCIGLPAITPEIVVYTPEEEDTVAASVTFQKKQKSCRIYINEQALQDLTYLAAVIAHEVTHIYRIHHSLAVKNSHDEELLTDLTAVYLGFGVLLARASYLAYSYADSNFHYWGTRELGYLSPQALCFLLGFQAYLRGATRWRDAPFRKQIGNNQQAFFKKSFLFFQKGEYDFGEFPIEVTESGFPKPAGFTSGKSPVVIFDSSNEHDDSTATGKKVLTEAEQVFLRLKIAASILCGFVLWVALLVIIENVPIRMGVTFAPFGFGLFWFVKRYINNKRAYRRFYESADKKAFDHHTYALYETDGGKWMFGGGLIGSIVYFNIMNQTSFLIAFGISAGIALTGYLLGSKRKYFICQTEGCGAKVNYDDTVCIACKGNIKTVRILKDGYVEYVPYEKFKKSIR